MPIVLIILLIVAALYGPQLWARYTFKRYATPRDDIPGNGAQLARHLLEKYDMGHVKVERTEKDGDHYDPKDKVVRLSPSNYEDRSLTAITVAAHEVGHAIQDHKKEILHARRIQMVTLAQHIQKIGMWVITAAFFLSLFSRNPIIGLITIVAGVAVMGVSVVVHLVTLPVEIDASFNKALPILFEGNYIQEKDRPAAKRILKAAAYTYVAASLASLLNLARWITVLRR